MIVKSWLTQNINDFLLDTINGIVQFFGNIFNNIFYTIADNANSNSYIINAQKTIILIALALVSLMVAKVVLGGYIMETSYDSDEDPFNLLVRIAEAVAVITNTGWIFDYMMKISKHFANDLVGAVDNTGVATTTNKLLGTDIGGLGVMASTFLGAIIVIVIAFIIFSVVGGLRGAELISMKLFGPFFALDLITPSRERFSNFMMAYVIAFFTFSFQTLFFCLALASYANLSADSSIYFLSTLVWLYIAIMGPKSIEKWLFKSGVTQNASSGIRMIVSTAAMKLI